MVAPVNPGDSDAQVISKLGRPTARYQDGGQQLLEYRHGPAGQQTYMARIGADGRLMSYEQVLTMQKFGTIRVGEATKADVLRSVGQPAEVSTLTLPQLEVWSYRYKENNVWNSMMHVHFDKSGIVRLLQNGPDPRYEEHDRSSDGGRR
ncbi:hypothetical protein ACFS07_21955 [Undibacterium arcticum]